MQATTKPLKLATIHWLGVVAIARDYTSGEEVLAMRVPAHGKHGVMPRRFHAKLAALGYDADRNVYPDTCGNWKIWIGQPKGV